MQLLLPPRGGRGLGLERGYGFHDPRGDMRGRYDAPTAFGFITDSPPELDGARGVAAKSGRLRKLAIEPPVNYIGCRDWRQRHLAVGQRTRSVCRTFRTLSTRPEWLSGAIAIEKVVLH
jgi:hypothetical protein